MILKAKQCGADAVKFQTYKAEEVTLLNTRKAKYQIQNTTKDQTQITIQHNINEFTNNNKRTQYMDNKRQYTNNSTPQH